MYHVRKLNRRTIIQMYKSIGYNPRIIYENEYGEVIVYCECDATLHVLGYGFEEIGIYENEYGDAQRMYDMITRATRVWLTHDDGTSTIMGQYVDRVGPMFIGHYSYGYGYERRGIDDPLEHRIRDGALYKVFTQVWQLRQLIIDDVETVVPFTRRMSTQLIVLKPHLHCELVHIIVMLGAELFREFDYTTYSEEAIDTTHTPEHSSDSGAEFEYSRATFDWWS